MKQKWTTPAIAIALAFSMIGCASSSKTTAMEDSATTMSETQVMAGETEEIEAETEAGLMLSVDNKESYDEMFDDIKDTKQYDLIALAKTSPNLSTFAALIEAAGIDKALKPNQKYTIFAPSNKAFSSLPPAELNMLMQPENKAELVKILQLHILPNEVTSSRFSNNQRIKAGEDKYINVTHDKNTQTLSIGGATVVRPDIHTSNGVLHVVDGLVTTTAGTAR